MVIGQKNQALTVAHFPKKRISIQQYANEIKTFRPRNWDVREESKRRAKAIRDYVMIRKDGMPRILGIDACSHEIGCRPETFATEFRFLREARTAPIRSWKNRESYRNLRITYHAGEDFLDIMDGLRAIDEAIRFLQFQPNDRLGHALALGVSPHSYYSLKGDHVVLPKQDILDNIVWALRKSIDWGISLDAHHRNHMDRLAKDLFHEIYYDAIKKYSSGHGEENEADYYDLYIDSWRLRGDHPDLYVNGYYEEIKTITYSGGYELYMKGKDSIETIRKNPRVSRLYFLYHFDEDVREKGLKASIMPVDNWYISFVEDMQAHMRKRIARRGIAIECNPSSNLLIGGFNKYSEHPIFKFFPYDNKEGNEAPHILTSINTDDIGVFDTSLANEYAMILPCPRFLVQQMV